MDQLIVNSTPLTVVPQALPGHPRGPHASFVVKATWQVAPETAPVSVPQPEIGGMVPLGEPGGGLLRPDELAPFKPVAEVLWLGSCHAPGGRPVPALRARLELGAVRKELVVFGPREWRNLAGGTPVASVPLTWDRAYGGPEVAANPAGTGATRDLPPPSIEHPKQLVTKPGAKAQPAGFGPIDPLWPTRDAILKRTDVPPGWLQQQPRRIPPGFDWRFYCDAPADQQLAGHLVGDEVLRLGCAHPAAADWRLPLPGVRPRLLARDLDQHGVPREREVVLKLDTVIYDGDAHQLSLLWRGLLPIAARDLEPLLRLALHQEALADEPAPLEALLPLLDPEEEEEEDAAAPVYAPPALRDQELFEAPPDGPWTLDQLHAHVAGGGDLVGAVLRGSELAGARLAGVDCSRADLRGCDLSRAQLAGARLVGVDATGCTLSGANLTGADLSDALLIQAQAPGVTLAGAKLDGAILQEARLDAADLTGASLIGVNAYNASLIEIRGEGLIATEAVFDYANLSKADLRRAELSGTSAVEGELADADLSEAVAEGANLANCLASRIVLAGAKLASAIFAGSTLARSDCRGVDLTGADCTAVVWRDSDLDDAILTEATCERAEFLRCRMARVQAAGASFDRARLDQIEAPGIDCSGASFVEASLRRARTPGATFAEAAMVGTIAPGWQAEDLQAPGLKASGLCDFTGARLARLQSPGSTWQRCALVDADLREANLAGADCSKCLVTRSRLLCADLAGSAWVGAVLEGVDLRHAKLTEAIFLQADCSDCVFDHAVLVGAELGDARFERCLFDHAKLERTARA